MNEMQKSYVIFMQSRDHKNLVHAKADGIFYVDFAKGKVPRSIIRYCILLRNLEIRDSESISLKQKYVNFSLTWFRKFRLKKSEHP